MAGCPAVGRVAARAGPDHAGDDGVRVFCRAVVQPRQCRCQGQDLDLAQYLGRGDRVGEPGPGQRRLGSPLGPAHPVSGDGGGPCGLFLDGEGVTQRVQAAGGALHPDPAGGCLGGQRLVDRQQHLHPDPLGRPQPPQRGQPALGRAGRVPRLPQRELEQHRGDDRHQRERRPGAGVVGCVRPVERAGRRDQAPHRQPGRQRRLTARRAAHQQHRAQPGGAVQRAPQQVGPQARQPHVAAGEPDQAVRRDRRRDRGEPEQQPVLRDRGGRLPHPGPLRRVSSRDQPYPRPGGHDQHDGRRRDDPGDARAHQAPAGRPGSTPRRLRRKTGGRRRAARRVARSRGR